ncbi:hypothetical protein AIOGIFDO_01257 [Candidatus Methanoperedenaceae archaeon GB37]|nr:hypothetical protein AIOGIFDO_01257 [Candidatus Methanoperedenaceae archaeon GB37]
MDTDNELVRAIETTIASVHDSQIDLFKEGEVVYTDKDYFDAQPEGYDATFDTGNKRSSAEYQG